MPNDDKSSLLDRLRGLLKPKQDDTPAPAPTPDAPDEPNGGYLRILLLLRQIPFRKLGPLLFTVPVIVFLAISGAVAWVAVGIGILVRIIRLVSGM